MGDSVVNYRIRIGLYNGRGRNSQRKFKKIVDANPSNFLSVFILTFLLSHNPRFDYDNAFQNKYENGSSFRKSLRVQSCMLVVMNRLPSSSFMALSWSYATSISALCHALNGNKRRLGYNLAVWNCRKGLIGESDSESMKLMEIKQFIQKHHPHTLGIIECDIYSAQCQVQRKTTFTTDEVISRLNIEGYNIELPDTWYNYGLARILVYVKDDINYKRKMMASNTDLPNISLEIGLGKERKTIVNYFYREWTGGVSRENNQASQINRLTRQIEYWRTLYSLNRDVICLGDSNLCALSWHENDYEANKKVLANLIQDHLLEESAYQLVESHTRSEMTRNGVASSCLDHVYTNSPTKCDKPRVLCAGDSDHLAVIVNKYSKEIQNRPKAVLKRSYKSFDIQSFLLDIQATNIDEAVTVCDDLEEAADVFEQMFSRVLDRHAPRKIFQTRKNYVPFLSDETKNLMKERDALKEEATQYGDEDLWKEYKKLRNQVKRQLTKDKTNYYKNKFYDNKMTVKQAWKLAYDLLGKSENKSPNKICRGNKIISDPKALATAFNEIFRDKVKKLRAKTSTQPKIDPVLRLDTWLSKRSDPAPEFRLKPISLQKLRKLMKKIKPSRSHGFDFIDSFSLKLAFPLVEDSILHLVNLSITTMTYSKKWKTQLVLPLHKKNDTMDGTNYRPVSHIIEVGKIAEYAVHDQVYNHFVQHNLFHGNHHGFLGSHSTASALVQLYDTWLSAAEKKNLSAALLLDLSAAFDIVDHSIFLKKLKSYKFSESTILWFQSYLKDRVQVVQVETKFSDAENLGDFAVPQGSILGPLIFLIFNNDFPASSVEGDSVIYADDDTDTVDAKDVDELQAKIQREADRSTEWVKDNRMVCSGSKTKLLLIGTQQLKLAKLNRVNPNIEINVCGEIVRDSKSERLLGLTVNNTMTWSDYLYGEKWRIENNCTGLIPQLNQRVGLLTKFVHLMPAEKFRLFCNGLFISKLIYCLQVFSHVWDLPNMDVEQRRFPAFTRGDNRKLQVLQNKVLRLKSKLPLGTPTETLLQVTGDLSVQQLTAFSTLTMAQRAISEQKPTYLANKLYLRSFDNYPALSTARHVNTLNIQSHLSISRGGFFCRSSALFNQLPPDLRAPMKPIMFKKKVKMWVKENIAARPG